MPSLARRVASHLGPGDILLLQGNVGAGKSTFARALIKAILLEDEDVPSPTFTLVQIYETEKGPLWHCDLYRVNSADELEELGLSDAFATAICVIEWPEILGDLVEKQALTLAFSSNSDGTARSVHASGDPEKWAGLANLVSV